MCWWPGTARTRWWPPPWRQRHDAPPGQPPFFDTRYDAGHVLACTSRRLVDVCAGLRLDVTQPELRGASMTALHRRWTERGDAMARAPPGSREAAVLEAMKTFCGAWAPTYDAVFYCCDRFGQHQQGDPYRATVLDLQTAADRVAHVLDRP